MDLIMAGDDLRITFHYHSLPLSLFRVMKGRKSKYLWLQLHRRPSLIHTLHVNRESCSHVVYGVYVHPSMKSCPVRAGSHLPLHYRRTTSPYATLTLS